MSDEICMDLDYLEKQLEQFFKEDIYRWQKIAKILIVVESHKLYQKRARSFSAWIRVLARKFNLQESNFWRCLKAGRYYLQISNMGNNIAAIEQAKVAPESLELLEKICRYAPCKIKEKLVEDTLGGDLKRRELREVWDNYRRLSEGQTHRGRGENKSSYREKKSKVTDVDIVEILRKNQCYLGKIHTVANFKLFTEVAVNTGSSRFPRRIDAVIVVQETPRSILPTIHGIEIKVDLGDLKRDQKLTEYLDFCHYFYLAVPNDKKLIKMASSLVPDYIGIIAVSQALLHTRFIRLPERLEMKNYNIYATLLSHSLGWAHVSK